MGRAHDRISELPDTVRLYILSLLPRKSAIRASALSSRWRDLWRYRWPYETTLDFGKEFAEGLTPEEFVSNFNRVLHLREKKKIEILQLYFYPGTKHRTDVVQWLEYAIPCGVEELYLDLSQGYINHYMGRLADGRKAFELPDCLFNSKSLTLLSLNYCDFSTPADFRRLRFLETLCLKCVNISDEMVVNVIANCPFLEKLDLRQCLELKSIKVSTVELRLKSLIVVNCWKANEIEIFAPNLRSFYFSGEFLQKYIFNNVSSLTDAMMSSAGLDTWICRTDWFTIFQGLAHVKVLTLCSRAVQRLALCKASTAMLYRNLQELQLLMDLLTETNLSDIHGFFRQCHLPNLEKLFIELPTGSKDPSLRIFLEMPAVEPFEFDFGSLRTIKMNGFKGHKNELELVGFFLEKAIVLESLVLVAPEGTFCSKCISYREEDSICSSKCSTALPLNFLQKKLLLMPKASVNVQIAVYACSKDDNSLRPTHYGGYF